MHHDRVRTLFRLQQKAFRQMHTDILLWLQKAEDLGLIFEVRTRRVAETVSRAAILLMEKVRDARGVCSGDAEHLARLFVCDFGECLGGFDRKAMQVEILGEVAGLEEL